MAATRRAPDLRYNTGNSTFPEIPRRPGARYRHAGTDSRSCTHLAATRGKAPPPGKPPPGYGDNKDPPRGTGRWPRTYSAAVAAAAAAAARRRRREYSRGREQEKGSQRRRRRRRRPRKKGVAEKRRISAMDASAAAEAAEGEDCTGTAGGTSSRPISCSTRGPWRPPAAILIWDDLRPSTESREGGRRKGGREDSLPSETSVEFQEQLSTRPYNFVQFN